MGWFIRKAFRFGPLRLNLSRGGFGASTGVKGLRLGITPRGKGYLFAWAPRPLLPAGDGIRICVEDPHGPSSPCGTRLGNHLFDASVTPAAHIDFTENEGSTRR